MDDSTREELLIRLDERTLTICNKLDTLAKHADNGGWSRCATRGEQIKDISTKIADHVEGHKWFSRAVFIIALTQIIVFVITFLGRTAT